MLEPLYDRFAGACLRRPWRVLAVWLVVLVVAAFGAKRVQSVLHADPTVQGSDSARVEARLKADFDSPYAYSVYVAVTGRSALGTAANDAALAAMQHGLAATPEVVQTLSYRDGRLSIFGQPGQTATAILVGLTATSRAEAIQQVPRIRQAIATALPEARRHDPDVNALVTGDAAMSHDMIRATAKDAQKAEAKAIPLTLILLVVVFGSLVAAALPLLVGIIGTIVSLGAVYLIGQAMPLSGFVVSIATMMGLGIGTDAGLFMVSRFREERAAGHSPTEAARITVRTTGVALTYSCLTVMLGFAVLMLVPATEIRSVGLGGLVEVGVCTLFALTALPAVLALLGDRLEAPRMLGRWLNRWKRPAAWASWSNGVMARPWTALTAGLIPLLLLSMPLAGIRIGLPDLKWVPAELEASRGFAALAALPQANDVWSLQVLVDAPSGKAIDDPAVVSGLFALTDHLRALPGVAAVRGLTAPPLDLPDWQVRLFLADPSSARQQFPALFRLFVDRSGTATQLTVLPKHDLTVDEGVALTRTVRALDVNGFAGLEGASLQAGGRLGFAVDMLDGLLNPFPAIITLVLAITGVMVFGAFRSYLLPLKALMLNALSVLAAFGSLVLVFQWGYGSQLLGVTGGPTEVVIVAVPVLVFCIVFGLSMDYEVLLLSRVREAYAELRDNRAATAKGLEATGGLITSAALIMAIAFGSFATADIITLKMLGFGLTVAVLLDATIIRVLLVPAFMRLAGRWNWYPGDKTATDS